MSTNKGGIVGGSKMSNVLRAKDDLLKTPEQLESEKKEMIASRTPKLDLERKTKDDLIKDVFWNWTKTLHHNGSMMVQAFYKALLDLHSYIYDLTERNMAQKYEMTELAERARQIEKGKSKNRSKNVFTGLGGSVFTRLAEFFPQAPPKISLFSPFERVNDRRSLAERRQMFLGISKVEEVKEKPKSKFDNPLENKQKKTKKKKDIQEEDAGEEPTVDEQALEEGNFEEEHVNAEEEQQPAEEEPQVEE